MSAVVGCFAKHGGSTNVPLSWLLVGWFKIQQHLPLAKAAHELETLHSLRVEAHETTVRHSFLSSEHYCHDY